MKTFKIYLLSSAIVLFLTVVIYAKPSFAAVNPSSWQTGATGLKLTKDLLGNNRTSGLSFWITDQSQVSGQNWPLLTTQGGVNDFGGYNGGGDGGPTGIQLGQIQIPGVTSSSVSSESSDWSHDQIIYNNGGANQLTVWASRISPAVLIQRAVSGSSSLQFFSGNVSHYNRGSLDMAPSDLKWIAYSTGGSIKVQQIPSGSNPLPLPTLDNNWVLVWYGINSHFKETQLPIPFPFPLSWGCCQNESATVPYSDSYQADAPMLMVFDKDPTSIIQSPNGGFSLIFANGSNDTSILPIDGRNHLPAATTESWGTSGSLPADIQSKISFWTSHLCSFPTSVSETYGYTQSTDTAQITETENFIPVCANGSGGIQYATIPPMVGVAYAQNSNPLKISFSGTLVNGNLSTDFGPIYGIENANSYSWAISGLNKYVTYTLPVNSTPSSPVPSSITQDLNSEIDKITSAGIYSPWIVSGKMTHNPPIAEVLFDNPADTMAILSNIVPAVSDPIRKTNLINYIKNLETAYPVETTYQIPLGKDTLRGVFNAAPNNSSYAQTLYAQLPQGYSRKNFLPRVILNNFYALSDYYNVTGITSIPPSVSTAMETALNSDMSNIDWANMYWFQGFDVRKTAPENINELLAGMIGLVRISHDSGDSATETIGRALLAKTLTERVAFALYPRYLYSNSLVILPANPAWEPQSMATLFTWIGNLFNYTWQGPYDDARQVTTIDQFETILYDNAGIEIPYNYQQWTTDAYATAFRYIVPETALMLKDFAKQDVDVYINKYTSLMPHWYDPFIETPFGDEHGFSYPIDSYQFFLAKDFIDSDTPLDLARYAGYSWLTQGGDLFYLEKLAEVVRAYTNTANAQEPPSIIAVTPPTTSTPIPTPTPTPVSTGLSISNISDNASSYTSNQIPGYEKYELTFQINNSKSTNFQLPFDPSAPDPSGIASSSGITVNALFLPPGQTDWTKAYTQPAFYYQGFQSKTVNNNTQDWSYPTNNYSWKVRFAPTQTGTWQYKLTAQDASGNTSSPIGQFNVTTPNSTDHGFIEVSPNDSRYLQFSDGTYFPALGYNMNYNNIDWVNPIQTNTPNFQKMQQNGIQLVRMWLSQWGIFGSQNDAWESPYRGADYPSLVNNASTGDPNATLPGSNASMRLDYSVDNSWQGSDCMFYGDLKGAQAVKPNTSYHIKVTYRIPYPLSGPTISGQPYGLVAKVGGWLTNGKIASSTNWRPNQECAYPSSLFVQNNPGVQDLPITSYTTSSTGNNFVTLEGDFTTDNTTTQSGNNFLQYLYLSLENVSGSYQNGSTTPNQDAIVYIDSVSLQENLGSGQYGPNIIAKPKMDQISYFPQDYSYRFDQVLNLAHQYGIYFKMVDLEKGDWIQNSIDFSGNQVDPTSSLNGGNLNFYGPINTSITKTRWYQEAYWRYLQARWGYSPNIESYELLNEGDSNTPHQNLANNIFAPYMHQFTPDKHLATTSIDQYWFQSFWQSPNLDTADIHQYTSETDPTFYDTALNTEELSASIGAKTSSGAGKPTMRGETGFVDNGNSDSPTTLFASDTKGIWLHKFIWGEINPGGLIESYWYDVPHIYPSTTGALSFDHRNEFLPYYSFISNIPLTNGHYQDVSATESNSNVRVVGQKDTTNGHAHLWIDNKTTTWNNVVNSPSAVVTVPVNSTVSFSGMPQGSYTVSWYDTWTGNTLPTSSLSVDSTGNVNLTVPYQLDATRGDIAVKVDNNSNPLPSPSPTPAPTYTVSGSVYVDANANGIQDNGEVGYQGAAVTLSGQTSLNAATDTNGNYSFTNVGPGSYSLSVATPSGYTATTSTNLTIPNLTQNTTFNVGIIPTSTPTPTSSLTPSSSPSSTLTPSPTSTSNPSPTPTPVISPTPCNITSATWADASVTEGTTEGMKVEAVGNCDGQQVTLHVRQSKTDLPDTDAVNQPSPNPVTLLPEGTGSSGLYSASSTWLTDPWINACIIIGTCDPNYFFQADLVNDTQGTNVVQSNPRLLIVTKSITTNPNPTNTPVPITNPTSTPTPGPNNQNVGGDNGNNNGGGGGGNNNPSTGSSSNNGPDINHDGKVDVTDLSILLRNFGTGDPNSDLNHDGIVDITDLSILLRSWTG